MRPLAGDDDARRRRIGQLEERLATLQREVDAARGEMAPGDVDATTLAEIATVSRELRELGKS